MTLYVVMQDYGYDGQALDEVFSTQENAQRYIDSHSEYQRKELYIEERELDEGLSEIPTQRRPNLRVV